MTDQMNQNPFAQNVYTFRPGRGSRGFRTPVPNKSLFSLRGLLLSIFIILFSFIFAMTPINLHSEAFWLTLFIASGAYLANYLMPYGPAPGSKWYILSGIPAVIFALMLLLELQGAEIFHAHSYAQILDVEDVEFAEDLPESMGTDSIALMDTASAKMLGDREIGSLSNVVSQYDVSDDYTQIDFMGTPKKVAPLEYADFFKWLNNRANGVPGYVIVDPVSMSADYDEIGDGMIYVPSAYFLQNAQIHMRLAYPTTMFGNLHFEIDETGKPYYVASVYKRSIGVFGGETVSGCIVLDPVSGQMTKYAVEDIPTWVDLVFDGYLLCGQFNWFGQLQNGYINSLFAKKGCKQVTTYNQVEGELDQAPAADFGYVAKDGDIWIYTGVTSVNNDSSNIGFLLANERTGEAHYFTIAGADEKSAMAAAEGEVQEKRYQASFPSLINIDGNPTYIMVLKDNSGLVKLYATVNVKQYNLVTTAATQSECIRKYRTLLGIAQNADDPGQIDVSALNQNMDNPSIESDMPEDPEQYLEPVSEVTITIHEIRYIDIDGNTYIYLISDSDEIYKAKVKYHEDMLLLDAGDTVTLGVNENIIVDCTKK